MKNTRLARLSGGGFVATLEFVFLVTILLLVLLGGCVVIRNALVKRAAAKVSSQVFVKDSTWRVIARPVSYDLCEAPQILCRDSGFPSASDPDPGPTEGLNALVGVRPDRFVTRNRVYFSAPGCDASGDVYLAPPPVPPPTGVSPPDLPVGYYNCGIQIDDGGTPVCYGVGPPSGWDPVAGCAPVDPTSGVACVDGGTLYRSDGPPADVLIASVWTSLAPDCTLEDNPGGIGEPTMEVCEDILPATLTVTPAVEVLTASGGGNLLAAYAPLFNVMPPPDLEVTIIAPTPEGPADPGDPGPLTFSPPDAEGTPP